LGHRISVRCFAGATSRRKRTARRMGLYSLAAGGLSTLKARTRVESRRPQIPPRGRPNRTRRALRPPRGLSRAAMAASQEAGKRRPAWGYAALRPHSSAVLGGSGGRCQFGGICARVASSMTRPALPENRLKRLAWTVDNARHANVETQYGQSRRNDEPARSIGGPQGTTV
jgi:hypothetical protein